MTGDDCRGLAYLIKYRVSLSLSLDIKRNVLVWLCCFSLREIFFVVVHLRRWRASVIPRWNALTWRNCDGSLRLRGSAGSLANRRLRGRSSRISVLKLKHKNRRKFEFQIHSHISFCFLFQAEDNDEVSGFTDDVLHRSDSVADPSGRIAIENAQNSVRHSAGDRIIIHESDRQHWWRRSRQH